MFSIIDNEIKVKIEILGGKDTMASSMLSSSKSTNKTLAQELSFLEKDQLEEVLEEIKQENPQTYDIIIKLMRDSGKNSKIRDKFSDAYKNQIETLKKEAKKEGVKDTDKSNQDTLEFLQNSITKNIAIDSDDDDELYTEDFRLQTDYLKEQKDNLRDIFKLNEFKEKYKQITNSVNWNKADDYLEKMLLKGNILNSIEVLAKRIYDEDNDIREFNDEEMTEKIKDNLEEYFGDEITITGEQEDETLTLANYIPQKNDEDNDIDNDFKDFKKYLLNGIRAYLQDVGRVVAEIKTEYPDPQSQSTTKKNEDGNEMGGGFFKKKTKNQKNVGGKFKIESESNRAFIKNIKLPLITGGTQAFRAAIKNALLNIVNSFTATNIIKSTYSGSSTGFNAFDYWKKNQSNPNYWFNEFKIDDVFKGSEFNEIVKQDINGKLVIKKDDGSQVQIEDYWKDGLNPTFNGKQIVQLENYIKCFAGKHGVGLIFNSEGKLNDGKSECLNIIKDQTLWKTSSDEIKKIHPKIAFNILSALNIRGEEHDGVMKVQSYDDWWSFLPEDAKKQLLNGKTTFQNADFIKQIIAFVNANPIIINSGDVPKSTKDDFGVRIALHNLKNKKQIKGLQVELTNKYNLYLSRMAMLTNDFKIFSPLPLARFGYHPFSGGNISSYIFPTSNYSHKLENFPKFSTQLRKAFKNLKSKLNSYNKMLSEPTEKSIEELFKSLEKHENYARDKIQELEYYFLSTSIKGDKQSLKIEPADVENAKKDLKEHFNKMNKRAISLLDITLPYNEAIGDLNTGLVLSYTQ